MNFKNFFYAVQIISVIVITFPSDYTTLSATTTPTCTNTNTGGALTCTVDNSAKTITISDYYATSATSNDAQVSVQIAGIINPIKAITSGRFHLVIQNTSGATIDESPPITNTNAPTLTFTSATFTCIFYIS